MNEINKWYDNRKNFIKNNLYPHLDQLFTEANCGDFSVTSEDDVIILSYKSDKYKTFFIVLKQPSFEERFYIEDGYKIDELSPLGRYMRDVSVRSYPLNGEPIEESKSHRIIWKELKDYNKYLRRSK